jgi:hypothetical protein
VRSLLWLRWLSSAPVAVPSSHSAEITARRVASARTGNQLGWTARFDFPCSNITARRRYRGGLDRKMNVLL